MWTQLLIAVATFVVMWFLRPKIESPKPAKASKLEIPKTQEGTEVGIVYGTVWIKDPDVVWYGDFDSEAIKKSSGSKK